MKIILVICTANICRSPMAAALLRKRIADVGMADRVAIESAGVWARSGIEASQPAAEILAARGISLAGHQSQPVSPAMLDRADLVLVMEEGHRRSLFYLAPQHLHKVFLLTEMAARHDDIADPYGGTAADYTRTADLLDELLATGLAEILRRLGFEAGSTTGSKGVANPKRGWGA